MSATKMQLEDWLDDLCVRFIINLPREELESVERICFQVEEAQWFYEDFIRPLDPALPSLSLKAFALRIFQHCPLMSQWSHYHHITAFSEFLAYKTRVPVRGAIMLTQEMDEVVLVKGWKKGANWSFPRGKINKDEKDLDCAIREVYEETGFDIRQAGLVKEDSGVKFIEITMREQHMRLYVFRGVPRDAHFEPRTRKEISKIEWYKLSELPTLKRSNNKQQDQGLVVSSANKFYMVAPFMYPLKKWIAQQKKLDAKLLHTDQGEASADDRVFNATNANNNINNGPLSPTLATSHDMAAFSDLPELATSDAASSHLKRLLNVDNAAQVPVVNAKPAGVDASKSSALLALLRDGQQNVNHDAFFSPDVSRVPSSAAADAPSAAGSTFFPGFPRQIPRQIRQPTFSKTDSRGELPPPPPPPPQQQQQQHSIMPLENPIQSPHKGWYNNHQANAAATTTSSQFPPAGHGISRQPSGQEYPRPYAVVSPSGALHRDPALLSGQLSPQTVSPAFQPMAASQRSIAAPFLQTGDPQFAQTSQHHLSIHGRVPPASTLPPPKLTSHSLALLNVLKGQSPQAQSQPLPSLPPQHKQPQQPHAAKQEANGNAIRRTSQHQDNLLSILQRPPPVPPTSFSPKPAELSAQSAQPNPRQILQRPRTDKPVLAQQIAKPARPYVGEGQTSATVSGPLNAPNFDAIAKPPETKGENGISSPRAKRAHQTRTLAPPITILPRPGQQMARKDSLPLESSTTSVAAAQPQTERPQPVDKPTRPFQPQILRRGERADVDGSRTELSPRTHVSSQSTVSVSSSKNKNKPAALSLDDTQSRFPFDRRPSQTAAQKETLLSLFGKPPTPGSARAVSATATAARPVRHGSSSGGLVSPLSPSFAAGTSGVSLPSGGRGTPDARRPSAAQAASPVNKAFLLGFLEGVAQGRQ